MAGVMPSQPPRHWTWWMEPWTSQTRSSGKPAFWNCPSTLEVKTPAVAAPEVKYAGPEEWAAVVMQMAETCYMLRPMVESQMRGKLIGILREMGVGRPKAPRASKYLPADVLDLLLRRSQNE